jgi:hypothetical protein
MMNLTQLNHFDQFRHDKLGFDCKKKKKGLANFSRKPDFDCKIKSLTLIEQS